MDIKPSHIFHNSQIALEASLRRLKLSLRQLRLHLSSPLYTNEELRNSSEEFHNQINMQLCFVNAQISTCETSVSSPLFQKKQQLHEIPYKAPCLKSSHCGVSRLILAYFQQLLYTGLDVQATRSSGHTLKKEMGLMRPQVYYTSMVSTGSCPVLHFTIILQQW